MCVALSLVWRWVSSDLTLTIPYLIYSTLLYFHHLFGGAAVSIGYTYCACVRLLLLLALAWTVYPSVRTGTLAYGILSPSCCERRDLKPSRLQRKKGVVGVRG